MIVVSFSSEPRRIVWILSLLFFLVPWVAGAERSPEAEVANEDDIRRVHVDPLLTEIREGAQPVLLDVRSAEEWQLGHIKGALHVPLGDLPERLDEIPRDREVVAYCSCPAEETSLAAARILRNAGFEQVAALVGGFERWKLYGGAVDQETSFEEMFAVAEPPRGWAKRPSTQHDYDLDKESAMAGHTSGRIVGASAKNPNVGALFQVVDAAGLAGESLLLTAALRSQGVDGGPRLWARADDAAGQPLAFVQSAPEASGSRSDWQRQELEVEVPAAAHRLHVGVMLSGGGTVWIDEVSLSDPDGAEAPKLINPGFED